MKKILRINETQYKRLHSMLEAHQSFLNEMEDFGKQLTEATLLDEGMLVDNLSGKFRDLVQKSGITGLKHAVSAAVLAGSLAGVSPDALAQAAMKAGVPQDQAKTIGIIGQQKQSAGNKLSKDLDLLTKHYVVDNADPQKQKQFMKFTGSPQDVIGIEPKNGYPIFAKGSDSQRKLSAALANPKSIKGIVNVKGHDLPGQFVECQGLWYSVPASKVTPPTPPPVVTPPAAQPPTVPTAQTNVTDDQEMIDFTGLFQGAVQKYKEGFAPTGGRMTPEQKAKYPSVANYIPDFLRAEDPGFREMSDQQIRDMFAGGLKASVRKDKFTMGGQTRLARSGQ